MISEEGLQEIGSAGVTLAVLNLRAPLYWVQRMILELLEARDLSWSSILITALDINFRVAARKAISNW